MVDAMIFWDWYLEKRLGVGENFPNLLALRWEMVQQYDFGIKYGVQISLSRNPFRIYLLLLTQRMLP